MEARERTFRIVEIGTFRFEEDPKNLGSFHVAERRSTNGSIPDRRWPDMTVHTAEEAAAALSAFSGCLRRKNEERGPP